MDSEWIAAGVHVEHAMTMLACPLRVMLARRLRVLNARDPQK